MNYNFFEINYKNPGQDILIDTIKIDQGQRPVIGTQMRFQNASGLWRVMLVDPIDMPFDVALNYFCERIPEQRKIFIGRGP